MIKIRRYVRPPKSVQVVLGQMDRACFPDDTKETWLDQIIWIALVDSKVAGYCACRIQEGEPWVTRTGVVPQFRGLGLHARMDRARCQYFRRQGYTHLLTYTSVDNITSQRNLIRFGYLPVRFGFYEDVDSYGFIRYVKEL